jgi:acyl-lipid omega-6 desaturase (Delta-12 desaturase)
LTVNIDAPAPSTRWTQRLAQFRSADNHRAYVEIILTALPFAALWVLAWGTLQFNTWAVFLFTIPLAGFLVRLFMIQHDCGHNSLFTSRNVNDWVGRILGVLTFTPYDFWRHSHALHHASSGNLDRRGHGDILTLTVTEYKALTLWGRLRYRLYRHPIVMFGIGPAYLFLLQQRLPVGGMKDGRMPWISTAATNVGIALVTVVMIWLVGWKAFLLIQLPAVALAGSFGVWLFYVQHQFEETTWERTPDWKHDDAALHGSSFYDLPKPIMWITGNIGMHHLHHLSSRIPFYKLPDVLKAHPELRNIGRLTIMESLRCVRLTLWCETEKRLVSFRHAAA